MSLHQHARAAGQSERNVRLLLVALALTVAFMLGEIVAAVFAGSLALIADAGHMLTDALALLMAVAAAVVARRPPSGAWTFGFGRAEVVSAGVNGVTLLVVSAVVFVEAVRRLVHPGAVSGAAVAAVAVVGLVVNVVTSVVLSRADRSSLNVAGAFAHVLTDAYAFAATLVAGIVIAVTGWRRADAVASLVVVVLMLRAATMLLRRSGAVLLERAPEHVDLTQLREHLLGTAHVLDIHDLHVWTVGTGLPAVSAHVVLADAAFADGLAPRVLDELQSCLAGHFDVEHSTFQLEPAGHTEHEPGMH
ncbi:MAG TPA: cation diffusion facilitator family transporter [Mycobacteriales bacterium]|nr:cation diffusion facilitator family transporter [Mycobacteriales bacterium]